MRLVNADAVLENIKAQYSVSKARAIRIIESAPTVDAVPIRHGHWVTWYEEIYDSFGIGYAPHYKCSECDTEYDQYDAMRMNYCPNCGVKLDGKDGDT